MVFVLSEVWLLSPCRAPSNMAMEGKSFCRCVARAVVEEMRERADAKCG